MKGTFAWLQAGDYYLSTVLISMALRAQRDQVLIDVLPALATLLCVMDLQVGSRSTGLTSPTIAPHHFVT